MSLTEHYETKADARAALDRRSGWQRSGRVGLFTERWEGPAENRAVIAWYDDPRAGIDITFARDPDEP